MAEITFDFKENENILQVFRDGEKIIEFNKWIAHDPNFLEHQGGLSKWEYIESIEAEIEYEDVRLAYYEFINENKQRIQSFL